MIWFFKEGFNYVIVDDSCVVLRVYVEFKVVFVYQYVDFMGEFIGFIRDYVDVFDVLCFGLFVYYERVVYGYVIDCIDVFGGEIVKVVFKVWQLIG